MSGLIDYVIKDEFFNSIKEEVTCSICLDIKIDPIMCTKCQNSYCSKCIKNWQSKSGLCPYQCDSPKYNIARVVKNLVSKLNFRCKNGCDKIINFEKIQAHYESESISLHIFIEISLFMCKDPKKSYFENLIKNYENPCAQSHSMLNRSNY